MQNTKAAAIQFNHRPGDKAFNLDRITKLAAQSAAEGVTLAAFPEMCITGYWHVRKLDRNEILELAEPIAEGPSVRQLLALAKQHAMTIGAGLIERGDDGLIYNSYVVAMSDGNLAVHRKLHCFINPHFASGDQYTVFDTPEGARVGVLICYDNNIGENVRATALLGADILLAPHQTGGCHSPSPHCMGVIDRALWEAREENPTAIEAEFRGPKGRQWLMRWLPARAHDNGLFVVFSNGVGVDDDEVRTGNSMVLDPYGRVLAETCAANDAVVIADLDPQLLSMCTGRRWIQSRRPELYQSLVTPTGRERETREVRFDFQP